MDGKMNFNIIEKRRKKCRPNYSHSFQGHGNAAKLLRPAETANQVQPGNNSRFIICVFLFFYPIYFFPFLWGRGTGGRLDCLQRRLQEACLLHLFSMPTSHLRAPFPAELPVIRAPLMGEAMQGEARGITTETAGALVTASLFSKPAQWQSGNFPLNRRKRKKKGKKRKEEKKKGKKRTGPAHVIAEKCTPRIFRRSLAVRGSARGRETYSDLRLCVPPLSSLPAIRPRIRSL